MAEPAEKITFRVSSELAEKIEEEREQGHYRVPRSEVVRAALEEYLCENSTS